MNISVREFKREDLAELVRIWNQAASEDTFPRNDQFDRISGRKFFEEFDYCGAAIDDAGKIVGLYVLYSEDTGRKSHIATALYAVDVPRRNAHIGEKLVKDSIVKAVGFGYRLMKFETVVASNIGGVKLFERLGFKKQGVVDGGMKFADGSYQDILIMTRSLP